jgi:hypothetical protein
MCIVDPLSRRFDAESSFYRGHDIVSVALSFATLFLGHERETVRRYVRGIFSFIQACVSTSSLLSPS